jgi:hypothetical protein
MKDDKDKERIACELLVKLFERDIAEIVLDDPRFMVPEQGPAPIVGKLLKAIDDLEKTAESE